MENEEMLWANYFLIFPCQKNIALVLHNYACDYFCYFEVDLQENF